jgi:hypothetical protein
MKRHIIYYKEEVSGFLASLGYLNIMNPNQFCDQKLVPFSLINYIVWFMHVTYPRGVHEVVTSF